MGRYRALLAALICASLTVGVVAVACAGESGFFTFPEQRRMQIRNPAQLPMARLPNIPPPATVSEPAVEATAEHLSLDEAIRVGLANSDVIRVLAGVTATSSGRTIYDPAIANTQIDEQRGRFDPQLQLDNNFRKTETPGAIFDPHDPSRVLFDGTRRNDYDMGLGVSKTTNSGGTAALSVNTNPRRWAESGTLPLNPSVPSSAELSLTQPILRGGGFAVNMAPIEIARIDTERSFFQMKGAVQRSVRDVIGAYWALVLPGPIFGHAKNRWSRARGDTVMPRPVNRSVGATLPTLRKPDRPWPAIGPA